MSRGAKLLHPYQRITSGGSYIPEIDGLRFVAIFSVYIFHLAGNILRNSPPGFKPPESPVFQITQILNVGVPMFFVISGFILGMPFRKSFQAGHSPSLKRYFWRRITRLEVPYLLALVIFFVLKVLDGFDAVSILPNLMASAVYVHNILYGRPSDINFVAWSLEVEVQFYLVAPLLARVFLISGRKSRLAVLAVAIALLSLYSDGTESLSIVGSLQFFLAGFFLVEWHANSDLNRDLKLGWDCVGIAAGALLLFFLTNAHFALKVMAPWLILLLYVAAFRGRWLNTIIRNRWITTIGGMCYSIYLLHNYGIAASGFVVGHVGSGLPFEGRLLVQFMLITPIVLTASALYFRLIERPCMRPDWPSVFVGRVKRIVRFA